MIRTVLILLYAFPATLFFGTLAMLAGFFSKTGNFSHKAATWWAKSILFVSNVNIHTLGASNIDPNRSYVFMANHQSNFDILALFAGLPVQFRWLAKAELFRIPIFAQGMRGCGYISIDRSDRESAFKSIREAAEKIKNGASVMIFPEGTRSLDSKLLPFKKGGFVLAADSGVPIVPMVITGSFAIMPKNQWKAKPGTICLEILPPIVSTSSESRNKDDLLERVRNAIAEALAEKEGKNGGC
jgi:1-acyl-sn-glycerol-3-phosphate acyltransferase